MGIAQLALGINTLRQIQRFNDLTSIPVKKTVIKTEHSNEDDCLIAHDESFILNWSEKRPQKSLSFTDKKSLNDSGVDSLSFSNKIFNGKRSEKKQKTSVRQSMNNKEAVPYEIGFVSGKFTIKCIVRSLIVLLKIISSI